MADNRTHPGSEEMLAAIEAGEKAERDDQLVLALARQITPIDDYDTDAENAEASLFVLLVRATKFYAAGLVSGETPAWSDVDTTLAAIRENLEMDYHSNG